MKSSLIAAVIALSIACFLVSHALLPKTFVGEETSSLKPVARPKASDTLALPKLKEGYFERTILKRNVVAGDTIGYILTDRYTQLRDSLSAFAKTGQTTIDYNIIPSGIRAKLKTVIEPAVEETTVEGTQRRRYVIRGEDREYLAAEIMGAEDASTDFLGKLSHLDDAGKSRSTEARVLKAKLEAKQAFIAVAKKRLAQKEEYQQREENPTTNNVWPSLSEKQRARILSLSAQLPIDTQRVFAPIAGRYYRPDDGVGYIIVEEPTIVSRDSLSKGGSLGFVLKAEGHPVLWGTAERIDTLTVSHKNSSKELKVRLE